MAQPVDGLYLNKYVDPQLLIERRNYRADFMQVLGCGWCTQKQTD